MFTGVIWTAGVDKSSWAALLLDLLVLSLVNEHTFLQVYTSCFLKSVSFTFDGTGSLSSCRWKLLCIARGS